MSETNVMSLESTDRQTKYVEEQEAKGGGLGVVFADAFLRGMRDIGYKNPAWALCELIDNSVQAGATHIMLRFGFDTGNTSKVTPDLIALVDNGVGMIPKMISYSVRWGGTDREDDRNGFGRYGYGLPSSCVSMAKRYTVYSKVVGGKWHAVTVDIDELSKNAGDFEATNKLLEPRPANPPAWTTKKAKGVGAEDSGSGTVIVLEDLDRLRKLNGWIKAKTLKPKLMQHFGVVYRHWLPQPTILVDDDIVAPVDPLFLMEAGRFHDETEVMAVPIETRAFELQTSRGTTGRVKVRASYLPPNFQKADPNAPLSVNDAGKRTLKGGRNNNRFEIMKDYNGLLVCREGRQIDCIQPRWTKFQNWDANVKIEIDFDPKLDEYFGITTAKQQIVIDDEMWDRIEQKGNVRDLVHDIRERRDADIDAMKGRQQNEDSKSEPRPSERAMMDTEKYKTRPDQPTPGELVQAQKQLEDAAAKISETTNRPKEEVVKELEERAANRKFEIEFQAVPEGPFYRPTRLGEQKRVLINTLHPFFSKVYEVARPESQAALEVMLFVLAESELESRGEFKTYYQTVRGNWSDRLRHALDVLTPDDTMRDKAAAVAEQMHLDLAAEPSSQPGA